MQPPVPVRASPRRSREDMLCYQCPELPLRGQCPHSAEGKLYLAQIALRNKQPGRAPARCTRCPNRPLRSECEHTAAGRTYLLQQQIQAAVTVANPSGVTNPPSDRPSWNANERPATQTPSPLTNPQQPIPTPSIFFNEDSVLDPTLPRHPDATSSHGVLPLSFGRPSLEFQLHPLPNDMDSPAPATPPSTTVQSTTMRAPTPATPASTHTASSSSQSNSTTPSKASQKHERATKSNPFYGFVKGSMRGTQDHVIFRRHKRPDPLLESKEASKTFLDKMNRLVERAEDISVKTGCWLFIGAQHPGGAGSTIHYTSPRLLRDAPDQAGDIVNDYHQLMTNLLQSRRLEALNLSQKYQASVAENHAMATRVADLESQMMTMQASIELYQARLFAQEPPTEASEQSATV